MDGHREYVRAVVEEALRAVAVMDVELLKKQKPMGASARA